MTANVGLAILLRNADKLRLFVGCDVWIKYGVLLACHGLPKNPSLSLTINEAYTTLNKIC